MRPKNFISIFLIVLSTFLMFLYVGAIYGLAILPGKPTVYFLERDYNLNQHYLLVFGLLGSLGFFLYGLRFYSSIPLALSFLSLFVRDASFLPLASMLVGLLLINRKDSLLSTGLVSIFLSLAILSYIGAIRYGALGWGGITVLLLAGMILGFSSMLAFLLFKTRLTDQRNEDVKGEWNGYILLLSAVILSIISVLEPHMRVHGGAVSLDTRYNYMLCSLYQTSPSEALAIWQRPLYMVTTCGLALKTHISLLAFYDKIVPMIGFISLSIAVWDLARRSGLGLRTGGVASVLSIAYWSPMFVYAGFQTNLLALPIALYLAYYTDRFLAKEGSWGIFAGISLMSLFMGLWHPWTLAYYTVSLTIIILLRYRSRYSSRNVTGRRILQAIIGYAPGWLAHLLVSLISGKSGVVSVASHLASGKTLLWSIRFFQWGTALRGDMVFFSAFLLYLLAVSRKLPERGVWVIGASAPFLLGLIIRNGPIYLRLMVDAPLALLAVLLYQSTIGESDYRAPLYLVAFSSLIIWAYYIFIAPLTPHPIP